MRDVVKILLWSFICIFPLNVQAAPQEEVFDITAYYTPEPDQEYYFKGSYEQDALLNGFGYMTASGSTPYLGTVAAPKDFEFGTLLYIQGKGWAVVEDRGGAIVAKNQRGEAHNRLDMWTGRGDEGVKKALEWGRRKRKVTVFGSDFENLPISVFDQNLDYDMTSDKVKEVQRYLKALGFFDHAVTGYYGDVTRQAVLDFQLWKGVIDSADVRGAGRVGPGTRRRLNNFAYVVKDLRERKRVANQTYPPHKKDQEMIASFYSTHLTHGDSNYFVFLLQSKLEKLGFFKHEYKTYDFKDKTKNALLRYQLARGIISSGSDIGAGQFGPATRQRLQQELSSKSS